MAETDGKGDGPGTYTAEGAWGGLCAAILERAILDACGDLQMRHTAYWGNVYMSTEYPVEDMRRAAYLADCNGDLIQTDLVHFFRSRYAKILADGAGLNIKPAQLWYRLRNECEYRREMYKRIFPCGNRPKQL